MKYSILFFYYFFIFALCVSEFCGHCNWVEEEPHFKCILFCDYFVLLLFTFYSHSHSHTKMTDDDLMMAHLLSLHFQIFSCIKKYVVHVQSCWPPFSSIQMFNRNSYTLSSPLCIIISAHNLFVFVLPVICLILCFFGGEKYLV